VQTPRWRGQLRAPVASANLLATFAPCEQSSISQRTRAALARARTQGVRLGRPPTMSPYAINRIRTERAAGKSLAAIANGLNADRIPTAQGGRRWYPATVRYTLKRTSQPPAPSQNAGSATVQARTASHA